jgi:tetratricopeptide (TPR) repeat protein
MKKENPKPPGKIIFLPIPPALHNHEGHDHDDGDHGAGTRTEQLHAHQDIPGFSIDPAIPIPVELPEGPFDPEDLSWEMILAGMLRILSLPPDAELSFETWTGMPDGMPPLPRGFRDIKSQWLPYYRRFVLALRPGILGEFTEAAILKAKNGDYDTALEIFAVLGGLFPGSPTALLNRALILEERADALRRAGREDDAEAETGRALEAYTQVLNLIPPLPEGFFNAGFFFMKIRDFEKAKSCFNAFIPLSDNDEKTDRARTLVREISVQHLDDEVFRAAYELIDAGRENDGIEKVRDFLERYPGAAQGWFTLGWGLRRLKRWKDGEASFRKAIELGGDNADTRNELAICLMEQDRLKEARKELEGALHKDPENVKIISNLGVLALKNGEKNEAAAFFRTVLELEPEDPIALKFLSSLEG